MVMSKLVPSSQVVSAWTLAALVARAVAVSAAVIVPLKFGVPSAWHFDAPVTTEILATTRVASVAHVVCVIATYVVWTEKSRWGIPTAGVVAATRRALAGVAVGFVVCFLAVVSLGVSSLAKPKETAHLALLVASLTCAPGAVRYGVPFTDRKIAKTWSVLLTAAGGVNDDEDDDDETTSSESKTKRKASTKTKKTDGASYYPSSLTHFSPSDSVWIYGVWGTSVGAWVGAMPIPLDWDRAWQKWPVSCVRGAVGGWVVGRGFGLVVVFARLFARTSAGKQRKTSDKKTR